MTSDAACIVIHFRRVGTTVVDGLTVDNHAGLPPHVLVHLLRFMADELEGDQVAWSKIETN